MSDNTESTQTLSAPDLGGGWDDDPISAANDMANEPAEDVGEFGAPKAPAETKKAPEPKPAAPKPQVFEIDGEKLTAAEIKQLREKAKGADQKFREAAEAKKQVEQFMERFQQDPLSILRDKRLPINQRELAEKMLLASLEEEMLTPEQRKLKEYEAKLQEFETKEQQVKREAEEREAEQHREIKRQEISQMFAKAMEITPLSKDPETAAMAMRDMAMMLRAAKERGIEVSAEELAQHAQTKYQKAMYSLANQLEGEDLIGFLGEDVVKKIRDHDINVIANYIFGLPEDDLASMQTRAVSDGDDYGKLRVYVMPRGNLPKGPSLVQGEIQSDSLVSETQTLLDGPGSSVQYGALTAIPIDGGIVLSVSKTF